MSESSTPTFGPDSDPKDFTVEQVNAYLAEADADERARVIGLEDADGGKARATITRSFDEDPDATPATVPTSTAPATVPTRKYAPGQGFGLGERAPHALYATMDDNGRLTLTGNGGRDELEPGSRGSIVVQAGDVVTATVRREAGLD